MMVVELSSVPSNVLPVAEFRAQLRMGTGFGEETLQDAVLENLLRAAIAAIEGRTGKALVERHFVWTLTAWRDPAGQPLPLAPVQAIDEMRLFSRSGSETVVEPTAYRLIRDTHRPVIMPTSPSLPTIATGGMAEIELLAGYGPAWSAVPPDLAHAAMLLAAHYYEHRHDATSEGTSQIPFGVGALIERYRSLRVSGWGAA